MLEAAYIPVREGIRVGPLRGSESSQRPGPAGMNAVGDKREEG